jgi:hypothetical protein
VISAAALPAFLPDQSANSGVLLRAENLYAAVDGYRPVPDFLGLSSALPAAFMGGASVIATDGTAYLLAGTAEGLYRLDAGDWTALVDELSISDRWRFAQFGNYALAVNGSATRVVDLSAGTDSALTGAPTGTSIAVIGDYVVIGGAGGNILKVQWSAFNDHTGWTDGTDQAGSQPMLAGGAVMGIAGGEYGVILQRNRIVRMSRTGDNLAPFQFDEITAEFGCASKASIAQVGRTVFFRSDRGFMALDDGQALRAIGSEKVDRTFDQEVSRDGYESLFAAVDPQNKLVMWMVPGRPATIWVYNFEIDRWTTIRRSLSGMMSGYTANVTLEALAAIYTDIDAMPYSLDDPRFSGGNPRLYIVDSDNKLGTFNGPTMEASIETSFAELTKSRVSRVRAVRLIGDMVDGVTVTLDARQRLGDEANERSATTLRTSGLMPIRHAGRFIKAMITIAAGTAWKYLQGTEIEYEPSGERQ